MESANVTHGGCLQRTDSRDPLPSRTAIEGVVQQMRRQQRLPSGGLSLPGRGAGVNHTHLSELLEEREGIALSRSTVRSMLLNAGMPSPRRRRPPRHRVRRRRFPQEGMLLQIDGSIHHWLEDRRPLMALLLAVDDATGTVPGALFQAREDTHGYFRLLWKILESRGIPSAAVHRPPWCLLVHPPTPGEEGRGTTCSAEEADAVRPSDARTRDRAGVRVKPTSQGQSGTPGWDVPGSTSDGSAACRCTYLGGSAIAKGLGISRTAVVRYVQLDKPPAYREGSLAEEAKEQRLTESLFSSP